MEEKALWTTFEKTGKIVDYLQYRSAVGDCIAERNQMGENRIEPDSNGHGNDTVRSTDW